MLEILYLRLRWARYEKVMNKYSSNTYYIVNYGIHNIKPQDIIGLSKWPPEKLVHDYKMLKLRESVKINGWNDPYPQGLHLYRMPSGKYTVVSGGNHRSILANELGVPEIRAAIDIVVPTSLISANTINIIQNIYNRINTLQNETWELRRVLDLRKLHDKLHEEEATFNKNCSLIDQLYNSIDIILMEQAHFNKLIK